MAYRHNEIADSIGRLNLDLVKSNFPEAKKAINKNTLDIIAERYPKSITKDIAEGSLVYRSLYVPKAIVKNNDIQKELFYVIDNADIHSMFDTSSYEGFIKGVNSYFGRESDFFDILDQFLDGRFFRNSYPGFSKVVESKNVQYIEKAILMQLRLQSKNNESYLVRSAKKVKELFLKPIL